MQNDKEKINRELEHIKREINHLKVGTIIILGAGQRVYSEDAGHRPNTE